MRQNVANPRNSSNNLMNIGVKMEAYNANFATLRTRIFISRFVPPLPPDTTPAVARRSGQTPVGPCRVIHAAVRLSG